MKAYIVLEHAHKFTLYNVVTKEEIVTEVPAKIHGTYTRRVLANREKDRLFRLIFPMHMGHISILEQTVKGVL